MLPLPECLDALRGVGMPPRMRGESMRQRDIDDLKFVADERETHLRHELTVDGVCPGFDMEYAKAIYLWTIEDPLTFYSFVNGHMHSGKRKKGKGGMSDELRACMPFAKVCCP